MSLPDAPPSAIVAGGGIGGMAAAIALGRADWAVTVLEQATVFWEAGAGLLITPNGERALDALGAGDAVRSAGHRVRLTGIRSHTGDVVVDLPAGPDAMGGIGVHRRALHAALTEAASEVALLNPGSHVLAVDLGRVDGQPATVSWQDATGTHTQAADLVVGAEGIHSIVRPHVAPLARLDATGYSSWRAVVADDALIGDESTVWWGSGAEFAAQRISSDRVSWQAVFRHADGVGFDDDVAAAREVFSTWAEPVRSLVAAAPSVVRHDLFEVTGEIKSYACDRGVLLGDAAHAMLPALAQGANLALEDAVTLGHYLSTMPLTRGLPAYNSTRRPRAQLVAERSRLAASLGIGSPLGAVIRALPDSWVTRWYRGVHAWVAPS